MTQLQQLTKPLPIDPEKGFVKKSYANHLYLTHSMVEQYLLATLGPFSFEVVKEVLGDMPPTVRGSGENRKEIPALSNVVVGAVCKLTVNVDGRKVIITEVGDCPNVYDADHDAQRLQQAASRGLVRCAMRLGLGLHLWCKDEPYFLQQALQKLAETRKGIASENQSASPERAEASSIPDEREPEEPNRTGIPFTPANAAG